jgi:hypothetical protein
MRRRRSQRTVGAGLVRLHAVGSGTVEQHHLGPRSRSGSHTDIAGVSRQTRSKRLHVGKPHVQKGPVPFEWRPTEMLRPILGHAGGIHTGDASNVLASLHKGAVETGACIL